MTQNLISNEISDDIINIDDNKIKDVNELILIDSEDQANNFDEENVFNNLDFTYRDFKEWHKY
jgi:hypothetical protein